MNKQTLKIFLLSLFIVFVPVQTANADFFDDLDDFFNGSGSSGGSGGSPSDPFAGLGSDLADLGQIVGSGFTSLGEDLTNLGSEIEGFFVRLYNDIRMLVLGADPYAIADAVIAEVSDENNCEDLPDKLDMIMGSVLPLHSLGLPSEFDTFIDGVSFTNLGIVGIDPATANIDDLYNYKVATVKPIAALKGLSQSYYKIPFIIGSAIANACADAAQYRISKRTTLNALHTRIHEALSNKKINNIQLQLPHSSGGNLEDVEVVLANVITEFDDLGIRASRDAMRSFEAGRYLQQQEEYQSAYRYYQKAYRILSQQRGHHRHHDDD